MMVAPVQFHAAQLPDPLLERFAGERSLLMGTRRAGSTTYAICEVDMSVPSWFDASAYFQNKCNASGLSQVKLKMAFESAGYSTDAEGLYRHFVDFGNAEGVSPNGCFNADEYLRNKAADFYGTTSVTSKMAQSMSDAMREAGMSPWDHYHLFWAESYASKGVFNNPSADFDVAAYMTDKLAQVQAAEPDANWTMDSLVEAFLAAGLSPVEHYLAFGAGEGLIPEAVSAGDSGTVDNVPGNDAFVVYNADSYTQLAGTDTTITLPDNANNICTGISTDNLKNADGLPITELNGGFTSNSFVVDGAISALLTINGGEGNNTFTVAGTDSEHVTISADLALTASGSGSNIFTVENVDIQIPDGALTITGGTGENTVVLGAGTDTIGADGISIMLQEQGNNTLLLDGCKPDILSGNSINIESTDFVDSIVLGSSTTGTFALNNASWTRLTSLDATESDTKLSFTYDLAPEKPLEVLAGKNDDTFTIKTADFENITLDGGEGYDIVQLYAGNSPVEIDLADGHFTNIEKFSMYYRNQQGNVTLNLVAAETGITVDASNAKTLSTLIITTSTHGDDITLLGNVPMNATVILTPSLDAAGNYLEMDTSINFFMVSACGYADGCKNVLDVRAFDLSGDGEFTLWQKGGYTDAKGVFHKTSYCDATGKSVVLLGWIEKSDPANVYLTTDASDAGSASGNAVLVEEGESYLFLLAKESVAVSGNDIGMYRVEIGADGDAEWVHIGTLGVNTLGGDMLDLQADNFLCC